MNKAKPGWGRRIWLYGIALLGVSLAVYLVHRGLSRYSFEEIVASARAVPATRLAMGAAFAAASYVCLTGFDWLALRYAGRPLPYRQAALASFTSLSLGHNIGFAALSSGAIRYRFYSRWGLSAEEIAKVVLFCGLTVVLGLSSLGGIALLMRPEVAERLTGLSAFAVRAIGVACLAVPVAYLALAAWIARPLRILKWTLPMPPLRLALAQIPIATANFACVAACLYAAIGAASDAGYWDTASAYVAGNVATVVTHVPGGVGVLEAAVLHLVPGESLIGPLLVFRATYFLVPLAFGLVTLATTELVMRSRTASAVRPDEAGEAVHDPAEKSEGLAGVEERRSEHRS